jgi:hypothetical protein
MNSSTKFGLKIKKLLISPNYLNRKRNFKSAFNKTIKVINSCNTTEELEGAIRMQEQFANVYSFQPRLVQCLEIELKTRAEEIKKLSKGEHVKTREKKLTR